MTCDCRGKATLLASIARSTTCAQEWGSQVPRYLAQCEALLCERCRERSEEFGLCCACGQAVGATHLRRLPAEVIAHAGLG
jgi:hypothetical protein